MNIKRVILPVIVVAIFAPAVMSQRNLGPAAGGENVLYGDVNVTEDPASAAKPVSFEIVLYVLGGSVLARQTVPPNGRYRFNNLPEGDYDIAVLVENTEITRVRVLLRAPVYKTDIRQ